MSTNFTPEDEDVLPLICVERFGIYELLLASEKSQKNGPVEVQHGPGFFLKHLALSRGKKCAKDKFLVSLRLGGFGIIPESQLCDVSALLVEPGFMLLNEFAESVYFLEQGVQGSCFEDDRGWALRQVYVLPKILLSLEIEW